MASGSGEMLTTCCACVSISRGERNEAGFIDLGRDRLPCGILYDVQGRSGRPPPPYGQREVRGSQGPREGEDDLRAAREGHRQGVPRVRCGSRHESGAHLREGGFQLSVRPVQEDHAACGEALRPERGRIRHRDGGFPRPGRIPDAHEHPCGAEGPRIPDSPAADRAGQAGDHRHRGAHRDVRPLHNQDLGVRNRPHTPRDRGEAGEGRPVPGEDRVR